MIDPRLRALLPLFAAVFIDIFSFGLMYPVIIALFHDPDVVGVYRPAMLDAYLSLAFSLFPSACSLVPAISAISPMHSDAGAPCSSAWPVWPRPMC